jgi:5'-deoxynucleotidase YfbR-like HD superfamily hydrolase
MEINYYRRLKNVNRLGTESKLRNYNLLEHSYMVVALFRHFASKEDVAYDLTTIDYIMHHDILEVISSDLPYTVKNLNEATIAAWEVIEKEVMKQHPQLQRYSDDNILRNMTAGQHLLFKACDLLDLWIFLKEEEALGNRTPECFNIIKTCERLVLGKFKSIDNFMTNSIWTGPVS